MGDFKLFGVDGEFATAVGADFLVSKDTTEADSCFTTLFDFIAILKFDVQTFNCRITQLL